MGCQILGRPGDVACHGLSSDFAGMGLVAVRSKAYNRFGGRRDPLQREIVSPPSSP